MSLPLVRLAPLLLCLPRVLTSQSLIDTGAEKKKLCMDTLKANAWIDFKETKDLVGDIKKLTDGMGAHATLVTAGTVRFTSPVCYTAIPKR